MEFILNKVMKSTCIHCHHDHPQSIRIIPEIHFVIFFNQIKRSYEIIFKNILFFNKGFFNHRSQTRTAWENIKVLTKIDTNKNSIGYRLIKAFIAYKYPNSASYIQLILEIIIIIFK